MKQKGRVTEITKVLHAKVPLIKFKYDNIDVDLSYCKFPYQNVSRLSNKDFFDTHLLS